MLDATDAGSAFTAGSPGCPDLDAKPDGGTIPLLIISAIDPGESIELFNDGESAVDLSISAGDLCSPFTYVALSTLAPGTIIGPGEYATMPWPGAFPDTETGGQIILYNIAAGHLPENIGDFVCWGGGTAGRKAQAEGAGKWSGDCAVALTAGKTIRRLEGTDGTTLASYNPAAEPQNCTRAGSQIFLDGFESTALGSTKQQGRIPVR